MTIYYKASYLLICYHVVRSKQVAKHSAASNALEILNKMGFYDVGGAPPVFNPHLHRNEPDNPLECPVNSIGNFSML